MLTLIISANGYSMEIFCHQWLRLMSDLSCINIFRITEGKKVFAMKKTDRDKKKVKEAILKRLRELEVEGHL